jgi:exonuclease SbcD
VKILHTADWHLNKQLGHVDRSADICRALEQIAHYLDQYQVDVMLVAGDIFEGRYTDQTRAAIGDIKRIFSPFLQRGGTIVAISGNHDSEVFFETLQDALALVAPARSGIDGMDATGRLYIAPNPCTLRLADQQGTIVQFVLMPYPTPRQYLRGDGAQFRSIEEKHRAIQDRFVATLELLQAKLDLSLPSVLVSHIYVRGVQVHQHALTEVEDVVFEPSDIPTHWAYIAYGHMHKPQLAMPGAAHVRYAGSIERLDAGDCDDQKSVVLCEICPAGLVGDPLVLLLESTPIYRIEITDPDADIPLLAECIPNAATALVHYTLHWQPGKHNRDELCRQIQGIFPRWYSRDFREIGRLDTASETLAVQRLEDVVGTVREYLSERLDKHPDRDDLLALAEELLAEEVGR